MNFKSILYTLTLCGIIIFGMMTFAITTQEQNSVNNTLRSVSIINQTYKDLNTSLSTSKTSSEASYGNFSKTPPTQEFGELQVTSILSVTNTAKTIISGIWNVLIRLPLSVLGVPKQFVDIIGGILLISIAIALWLLWKGVSN